MVDAEQVPVAFPRRSHAEWRAGLEAELGLDGFARKLISKTTEGLEIEPLYEDAPGRFAPQPVKLVRGLRAEVDVDARGDLDEVRDGLRRDLAHGVRGLRFKNLRPFNLDYLLDGVDLTEVAVHFEGGDPIEFGQALLRVTHETKFPAKTVHGGFGALGRGGAADFARWVRVEFVEMTTTRLSVVDECNLGAGVALQLGIALAAGAEKLEEWRKDGFELELCCRAIEFEFALGTDVFLEVAKLRAARLAWAKLVAACGGDAEAQTMRIAARASMRSWTRYDPWTNLLRGTTMTFAASVGGADSFTLLPYDACLGTSDAQARRLAANTQAILARESGLGAVTDPAAGSGYVEALTADLAREGWARFQEIQRLGGLTAARESGWVEHAIDEAATVEAMQVRTRKRGIIGISEYPLIDEELPTRPLRERPQQVRRLAVPFEALRYRSDTMLASHGSRPQIFLANLGAIHEHRARAAFAENLFAAGGIESIPSEGSTDHEALLSAFSASGTKLCAICSSDERYVESVPDLARELCERGATVIIAGRPGEHEAAWREAGVKHFIHLGCDAIAVLEQLLEETGVCA